MLTIIVWILSAILLIDCFLLVLLVLVQIPKKESGMAGTAFGGAATDALFGAGSGTALSRITKWLASTFIVLSLVLSVIAVKSKRSSDGSLEDALRNTSKTQTMTQPALPEAPAAATTPTTVPLTTPAAAPAEPAAAPAAPKE